MAEGDRPPTFTAAVVDREDKMTPVWYRFISALTRRVARLAHPKNAELTIASGVITVTGNYHDVDTESDGASDDLDTINGGIDGAILILRANNSARSVVVKDATGNIQCAGDMTLDNIQDTITLIYDAVQSAWLEIARSNNGA